MVNIFEIYGLYNNYLNTVIVIDNGVTTEYKISVPNVVSVLSKKIVNQHPTCSMLYQSGK